MSFGFKGLKNITTEDDVINRKERTLHFLETKRKIKSYAAEGI
jgi:hypothetical protein